MTPNSPANYNEPFIPYNIEALTQSPNKSIRLYAKGLSLCIKGAVPVAFGMWTVLANNVVRSKLNQPADDFLTHHCFSNMTSYERTEYSELSPDISVYFAQAAITATGFFIANGGLCRLYGAGKSIYDRVCSHFSAPDSTINQPEEV